MLKLTIFSLIAISLATVSSAGFRCTFGDFACNAGCKTLGQSGGICDKDGKCWCSEQDFNLLEALLPSRCDLGESFCAGTCHSIGRKTGICVNVENAGEAQDCQCSDEKISPTEFGLCAMESTCRTHCQAKGKSSGKCEGWDCQCQSFGHVGY